MEKLSLNILNVGRMHPVAYVSNET
jgi:hypothetical protein